MKKRLLLGLAALAAVTLTSCQKDQVINETPQQNAIEFGTYLGRDAQTKGSVLTTDGLKTQGFGVYAYYTATASYDNAASPANFMRNQKVEWSDTYNSWTYSPVKYWSNNPDDKHTFFAYAPYFNETTSQSENIISVSPKTLGGDPYLAFVTAADVNNQVDLLYADCTNTNKQNNNSLSNKVNFNFKHALSRVGFKVEYVADEVNDQNNGATPDNDTQHNVINAEETTIKVNEVELISDFNTNGTLNLNSGNWTYDITRATSYLLDGDNFEDVANNVINSPSKLNKDDSYLMIIPRKTNNLKIRVHYTVTTTDGNLDDGKIAIDNNITSSEFEFNFEKGKAYNFVLHLGLNSVKFTADVTTWDPANGSDVVVNVPLNF